MIARISQEIPVTRWNLIDFITNSCSAAFADGSSVHGIQFTDDSLIMAQGMGGSSVIAGDGEAMV